MGQKKSFLSTISHDEIRTEIKTWELVSLEISKIFGCYYYGNKRNFSFMTSEKDQGLHELKPLDKSSPGK